MREPRNIKLTIAYDGTRYNGWQRQKATANTIQSKLESMLSRLLDEEIEVLGSGRTDAGVHAKAQIANFHTATEMGTDELLYQCNQYLPGDIAVVQVKDAAARFHSRLNAKSKHYRYRIWNSPIPNIFEQKYMYQLESALDIGQMRKAASVLEGKHDFQSFCANKRMKKSTERIITSIDILQSKEEVILDYYGNGFLHNMVRILTGILIEVGTGQKKPEDMKSILEAGDRIRAGFTAPAQGLILMEVMY